MQLEVKDSFNRTTGIFLIAGFLSGAVLTGLVTGGFMTGSGQTAANNMISTLEQSSGQDFELVSLDRRNGLYRAQIKNQNDQLTTYYITENGEMILQESGLTDLSQLKQTVDAQAEFTGCMADRNVVMYGNTSQQETAAQIQLLGGANMVSDIYKDINQRENLREAINRGIQRIPGFYHDNSTLQGVQSVANLENFTGCTYSAEN